jgi:hypothetical protein
MTSLPPAAAGLSGDAAPGETSTRTELPIDQAPTRSPEGGQPAAAITHNGGAPRHPGGAWEPRLPSVRPSSAHVELSLDLRGTAPDKALSRVLGALERVSDDVTLIVLLRDTPEFVGVVTSVFSALRQRGYWSDSSRFPAGVQRIKIARRQSRGGQRQDVESAPRQEPTYSPAPASDAVRDTPRSDSASSGDE